MKLIYLLAFTGVELRFSCSVSEIRQDIVLDGVRRKQELFFFFHHITSC